MCIFLEVLVICLVSFFAASVLYFVARVLYYTGRPSWDGSYSNKQEED